MEIRGTFTDLDHHQTLAGLAIVVVLVVGAIVVTGDGMTDTRTAPDGMNDTSANYTDWRQAPLETVRGGEEFTIGGLGPPVIVEMFAVWCGVCTKQQREFIAYRQREDAATIVSLNVDPSEDRQTVADHADGNGFDWRYAIAPTRMTDLMLDQYGSVIVHPPSVPAVLVCANGTRLLPTGVKSPDKLASEVAAGC